MSIENQFIWAPALVDAIKYQHEDLPGGTRIERGVDGGLYIDTGEDTILILDKDGLEFLLEIIHRCRPADETPEVFADKEKMKYDAEELECTHLRLDDLGVPRANDERAVYSLMGRIDAMRSQLMEEHEDTKKRLAACFDTVLVRNLVLPTSLQYKLTGAGIKDIDDLCSSRMTRLAGMRITPRERILLKRRLAEYGRELQPEFGGSPNG